MCWCLVSHDGLKDVKTFFCIKKMFFLQKVMNFIYETRYVSCMQGPRRGIFTREGPISDRVVAGADGRETKPPISFFEEYYRCSSPIPIGNIYLSHNSKTLRGPFGGRFRGSQTGRTRPLPQPYLRGCMAQNHQFFIYV